MRLSEEAAVFAIAKHQGARRKYSPIPFFLHPMEAAAVVASMTDDEEIIAAALLHDVVEDTDGTIEEIRYKFGDRVANLVAHETENKRDGVDKSLTWKARKEETIANLRKSSEEGDNQVLILWLGDKLSNMRSFYRLFLKEGEHMFDRFNCKDYNLQKWYYMEIKELLRPLSNTTAWQEYSELCDKIFAK